MAAYKNILRYGVGIGVVILLTGCATVQRPVSGPVVSPKPVVKPGVQHKVCKGETLWRIARTYRVSVEEIVSSNGIPNAASIEENQLLFIPGAQGVKTVDVVPPSGKDEDYAWPVRGRVISYFQDRQGAAVNAGIDVKAVEGDVVRASRDGRVVLADHLAGYGQTLIIEHADGYFTVYGHNAHLLVKLGDHVLRGEKIAQIAREGDLAYLHFEVRKGDRAANPLHYLP